MEASGATAIAFANERMSGAVSVNSPLPRNSLFLFGVGRNRLHIGEQRQCLVHDARPPQPAGLMDARREDVPVDDGLGRARAAVGHSYGGCVCQRQSQGRRLEVH